MSVLETPKAKLFEPLAIASEAEVRRIYEHCCDHTAAECARMKGREGCSFRRELMGEAQDIVGKPESVSKSTATLPGGPLPKETVLQRLTAIEDDVDRAIQVKERDLHKEKGQEAENYHKLGILHSALGLIRHAHSALEDYGVKFGTDQLDKLAKK